MLNIIFRYLDTAYSLNFRRLVKPEEYVVGSTRGRGYHDYDILIPSDCWGSDRLIDAINEIGEMFNMSLSVALTCMKAWLLKESWKRIRNNSPTCADYIDNAHDALSNVAHMTGWISQFT